MKRWFVFVALVALGWGCAPALKDLKSALSATDSGNIWFGRAPLTLTSDVDPEEAFRM